MNQDKRVIVTHCVDPHHFYFKYANDCVNNESSKFDYEIQCYGNDLHTENIQKVGYVGHSPSKNETIIFYDVIFNKWLRGRVINDDDKEIILWCIDNEIFRRSEIQFIQPLTEILKRNLNLVHLGGITLLPAENKLNFNTLNVKMEPTTSWDNEMKNNFKAIINSNIRISFIQEMQLGNHKFGSLLIESKKDKVVVINEILLQMNKAMVCGRFAEDLWLFVSKKRIEKELDQSYEDVFRSTSGKPCKSRKTSYASDKSKTNLHSKSESIGACNDSKLSSDIVPRMDGESRKTSYASDKTKMNLHSKSESIGACNGSKLSSHIVPRMDGDLNVDNDNINEKFENLSVKSGADVSSTDEHLDSFNNSASMVLSSICLTEEQSLGTPDVHQIGKPLHYYEHECYLGTFGAIKNEKLRHPMQASLDRSASRSSRKHRRKRR